MTSGQGMVEGSASEYRWILSYDREAQLTAMGGPSVVNPLLDSFFANLDDFSGVGALMTNEFELGAQYWDSFTGEPWKTQDVVNRIRTQTFADKPEFIDNNDDLGALSSQLVWSMLGLFPDYPGSAMLTINGPQFPAEYIHLPSGASILVTAANASATAPYIQSHLVNGQPSTKQWLDSSFVQTGGSLELVMGATANTSWGVAATDAPPSYGMRSLHLRDRLRPGRPARGGPRPHGEHRDRRAIDAQRCGADGHLDRNATGRGDGRQDERKPPPLAAGAQATADAFRHRAGKTQGRYTLPFALTSSIAAASPGATLAIIVATPGSFWPYFNNAGVSDDGSGNANFDGVGYSYSSQAPLPPAAAVPAATLSVGGITYTWPNEASGALDNVEVSGQTVTFSETAVKKTLGLLGSATNAGSAGAQGTVTVTYADNTTQAIPVAFTDWTRGGGSLSPAAGNVVAVTAAYRNAGGNKDTTPAYVFAVTASLTSTQPVTSVTLPAAGAGGNIHIFDIELQ